MSALLLLVQVDHYICVCWFHHK